jgi:hypothetical protein
VAFALVLAADFSVGRRSRGLALAEQIGHVWMPEGLVYAAALVLCAAMPAIVHMLGGRR